VNPPAADRPEPSVVPSGRLRLYDRRPGRHANFYAAVYNILDGDEKNPRIKLFEAFGASVQALLSGDADLVLIDDVSGKGYMGANPGKLKIVGGPLGTEEFGFIFNPGSSLAAPFNKALAAMKADGFLDKPNVKWFFEYRQ
jgi:polar amino acid transport system substrate-binding protein